MYKTFKYRLYPTKSQCTTLSRILEECRWLYNETLSFRKDAWEKEKKRYHPYEILKLLPLWKKKRPSLKIVHSQSLQNVQLRVDAAFQTFFRRVRNKQSPGYPRFKGYGNYDSITYSQSGFTLMPNELWLSKVGSLHAIFHRPIEGKVKSVTVRRAACGDWFAHVVVECTPNPTQPIKGCVGLDVGIRHFVTMSTGDIVENPRFYSIGKRNLARTRRRLKGSKRGTKGYTRRLKAVSKAHKRIVNRRRDFLHKLSRKIVNCYGTICVEDLAIRKMMDHRCLKEDILDASWGIFFNYLQYKAESARRRFIRVNPAFTSRICSRCGHRKSTRLNGSVYRCPCCDLVIDRDLNASYNILALGLQSLGEYPLEAPVSVGE